jgi:hypothetical protein
MTADLHRLEVLEVSARLFTYRMRVAHGWLYINHVDHGICSTFVPDASPVVNVVGDMRGHSGLGQHGVWAGSGGRGGGPGPAGGQDGSRT